MVRMLCTAEASLAAMRERKRLGIAIAAMIRMIATTISNSISEKPFCFRISRNLLVDVWLMVAGPNSLSLWHSGGQLLR